MSTSISPSNWPTVTALAEALSSALGVSDDRRDLAVHWLAERDLIPATDQPASFDDSATLLIALATNTGEAPHRAVERFGGLPLGGIEHYEGWPVGGFAALPQDHPVIEEYRANFPTFRDCLAYCIATYLPARDDHLFTARLHPGLWPRQNGGLDRCHGWRS